MRPLVLTLLLLGCGSPKPLPALDVRSVAWTDAPLGKVAAVAEADDVVTVFSDRGAVVLGGGVELAVDASVTRWVSAATVPAADGNGTWMVGVDADGRVYRVRDRQRLERISTRFGLGDTPVRAVVALGQGRIAFALDTGLALTDGGKLARYDYAFTALSGGAGRGVGIAADAVQVFDPYSGKGYDRRFVVPEARFAAIDERGRLVVANDAAVWTENPQGLALAFRATGGPLHGLAASGARVWFAAGTELGTVDDGLALSTGAHLPATARLASASGGDVWALADGQLLRYSTARGASTFDTQIAPIARRVCTRCHGPGTMLPLLTRADWEGLRTSIVQRVVQSKTMPPAGTPFSESERAAIAAWATR